MSGGTPYTAARDANGFASLPCDRFTTGLARPISPIEPSRGTAFTEECT